ncbi:hypothetical protein [Wolbachia endosymbiont of Pentidionis agamae]|uniref:hypothetical protein n=1 Tax=Wolbachia endosymbiont of Pentidionis agamae TaxID=3110435 RepID=UPI002FD2726E
MPEGKTLNLEEAQKTIEKEKKIATDEGKDYEDKINKYNSFLENIKDRTFLDNWYEGLHAKVTIDESVKNILCPQEKNPTSSLIKAELNNWFIKNILHMIFHNKLKEWDKHEKFECSPGIVKLLEEKVTALNDKILDPEKFISAIKQALSHSDFRSHKLIFSKVVVEEIKHCLSSTQAEEILKNARMNAYPVWHEKRDSPLHFKSFIEILLRKLDDHISKCGETGHLLVLEKSIVEEVKKRIFEETKIQDVEDDIPSRDFIKRLAIRAIEQKEYNVGLAFIIDTINPSDVIKAQCDILDDMLIEAIKQDKKDLAMLLIFNGADIDLTIDGSNFIREKLGNELLTKPVFTEISRLYSSMPKIRARFEEQSELKMIDFITAEVGDIQGERVLDTYNIFDLKELGELLPSDTAFSKVSSMLQSCKEEISCKEDKSSIKIKRSKEKDKGSFLSEVFKKEEVKKLRTKWGCAGGGAAEAEVIAGATNT